MGKYKLRHGSIQVRVLALTLLFTLGVSLVIAIGNMRQMAAKWERTTLLNAELALQTACHGIPPGIEEVDDMASWCCLHPSMRTYLLIRMSAATTRRFRCTPLYRPSTAHCAPCSMYSGLCSSMPKAARWFLVQPLPTP